MASIKSALARRHMAEGACFIANDCGYASMTTSSATIRTPELGTILCIARLLATDSLGSYVMCANTGLAVVNRQMTLTKLVWEPQVVCEKIRHVVIQLF